MRSELTAGFEKRFPLSSCLELCGFLDDRVVLTYCGDCFVFMSSHGVDCEALGDRDVEEIAREQEQARRVLGPEHRLYEYMMRRREGDGFYSVKLAAAILKMAKRSKHGVWSSSKRTRDNMLATISRNHTEVIQVADAFTSRAGYKVVGNHGALGAARSLLNIENDSPMRQHRENLERKRPIQTTRIDRQIGDHDIEVVRQDDVNGPHMRLGSSYVRVLTLDDVGPDTRPCQFAKLQEIEGDFYVCSEWNVLAHGKAMVDEAKKIIDSFKGQSRKKDGDEQLVDQGDVNKIAKLGGAQVRLDEGERVGHYSFTAVVYGSTLAEMVATQKAVERVLAAEDCKVRAETYNQLAAFMATVPGGYGYQFRKLRLMERNVSDLGFWYAPSQGYRLNDHLRAPSLLTLASRQGTRFDLNLHLHGDDVGHTFVLGETGSGKSFTSNTMLYEMMRKYDPYVAILDKSTSYRWMTQGHGGSYYRISSAGLEETCKINPFSCEASDANLKFLKTLVRILIEQASNPLTADELERVHVGVEEMFLIPAEHRRLGLLGDLLGGLGKRLNRWVQGGEYGWVFDNAVDTLSLSKLQCFEFEGTDSDNKGVAEVLEPLILTIIHRVTQPLYDESKVSRLKVFLLGELWSLLRHPAIESVTEELLRRARAKNGIVIMETQSPLEIANSRIGQVILNACATRIYMASAIDKKYEELLQLNERKRDIIRNLRKKKELFFDQPRGVFKKLVLEVPDEVLWLAANDPDHNGRRREAMEKHGPLVSQWLPALIGSNGGSNKCVVS